MQHRTVALIVWLQTASHDLQAMRANLAFELICEPTRDLIRRSTHC